jgi:hypothetical protein
MGISSVNKRKRDFQTTFPQTDGAGDACSLGSLVSVKVDCRILFCNTVDI